MGKECFLQDDKKGNPTGVCVLEQTVSVLGVDITTDEDMSLQRKTLKMKCISKNSPLYTQVLKTNTTHIH